MSWSDPFIANAADLRIRVSEIENKIGAGLIEEVIQVAAGELELVDVMAESQAYVFPSPSIIKI